MTNTDAYAGRPVQETLTDLGVQSDKGLMTAEVEERQNRYGFNEVSEKEEALWHRILRRFWGPIAGMIEIAAVLSAIVGKWDDFVP